MVKLLVVLVLLVLGMLIVVVLEVVVTQPSNAGCRYDRRTVYLE